MATRGNRTVERTKVREGAASRRTGEAEEDDKAARMSRNVKVSVPPGRRPRNKRPNLNLVVDDFQEDRDRTGAAALLPAEQHGEGKLKTGAATGRKAAEVFDARRRWTPRLMSSYQPKKNVETINMDRRKYKF